MARGLSGYVDSLIGKQMETFFREWMPIDVSFLGQYPDWFAFLVVMLLVGLLCVGVKESSVMNNVFTTINVVTICIMVTAGALKCKSIF